MTVVFLDIDITINVYGEAQGFKVASLKVINKVGAGAEDEVQISNKFRFSRKKPSHLLSLIRYDLEPVFLLQPGDLPITIHQFSYELAGSKQFEPKPLKK